MGLVRFQLVDERENILYESNSLSDVYLYCKARFDATSEEDWFVNEVEDENFIDCASVIFLLETYPSETDLPDTISDICPI